MHLNSYSSFITPPNINKIRGFIANCGPTNNYPGWRPEVAHLPSRPNEWVGRLGSVSNGQVSWDQPVSCANEWRHSPWPCFAQALDRRWASGACGRTYDSRRTTDEMRLLLAVPVATSAGGEVHQVQGRCIFDSWYFSPMYNSEHRYFWSANSNRQPSSDRETDEAAP